MYLNRTPAKDRTSKWGVISGAQRGVRAALRGRVALATRSRRDGPRRGLSQVARGRWPAGRDLPPIPRKFSSPGRGTDPAYVADILLVLNSRDLGIDREALDVRPRMILTCPLRLVHSM